MQPLQPVSQLVGFGPLLGILLKRCKQAPHHCLVERADHQSVPQAIAHSAFIVPGVNLQQLPLAPQNRLQLDKLLAAGRHGMDEEFELAHQVEHRLVVERQLDELSLAKDPLGLVIWPLPLRTNDRASLQGLATQQALGHLSEAFQGNLLDRCCALGTQARRDRRKELGKVLTALARLLILQGKYGKDIGAMFGTVVIDLAHRIGIGRIRALALASR